MAEIRQKFYQLVEPLRAMPKGNKQFLKMLGIPLGLLERSDRLERLAKGERVDRMELVEKRVESAAPANGVNLLKWKADSPSGAVYLVSYAIGAWQRGSPTPPTSWNLTPILIPEK